MTLALGQLPPHSRHTAQRSKQYHDTTVSTSPRYMDQDLHGSTAMERLNPNDYGPAVRSYPGLAN